MRLTQLAAERSNLAIKLESEGKLEEAAQLLAEALDLDPNLAEAWSNLGNIRRAQGRPREAVACYLRAITIKDQYADAHSNLGAAYLDFEEIDSAKAHLAYALGIDGEHAQALNNMGTAVLKSGDPKTACYYFQRAIAANPEYAQAYNNRGNALKELGDLDAARQDYVRAIQLKPDYAEAHFNRSDVVNYSYNRIPAMRLGAYPRYYAPDLLPEDDQSNMYIQFALGRAYEQMGDYERAWQHFEAGNKLKRAQIADEYDEPQALEFIERIKRVFVPELFERFKGSGHPSTSPIFIVGFPRCGSTLVEQILASHPQIHGAGEILVLEKIGPLGFPECFNIDNLPYGEKFMATGAASYLSELPETTKPFVVDKLLGNFLRVGLIKLILPNAKVIHCVRDPLDTCVSCYCHLFAKGIHFSYDLGELGRYYRAYASLMAHWYDVLPGFVTEVEYESLILADGFERAVRYLLEEIIGVPFDPACLEFWKTQRPVRTASAVQVRQPLFTTSLGKWKHYEPWLGPLKEALQIEP